MKVYIPREFEQNEQASFDAIIKPEIQVDFGGELPETAEYEVLAHGRPTEEQLDASPHLKTLIVPFAGVPPETLEKMKTRSHIAVHNLHWNAEETAEMALALMMSAAKMIVPHDREFRTHSWRLSYGDSLLSRRLAGKNALVLGFGAIGQRIAQGCLGLGMHVSTIRRNPSSESVVSGVVEYGSDQLQQQLSKAEVLIVALPLTPETEGLLAERELSALQEGSIVVNIGRGKIIDETALFEALKSKHLHSAGLDVWYNYPKDREARANTPPSKHPFHELENVVMSPHRAADSEDFGGRWTADLAAKLNMLADGKELPHRVDVEAGY